MHRRLQGGWTDWLLLAGAAVLFLAVLLLPLAAAIAQPLTSEENQLLTAYQNNEIIRLHILANSDSPRDQTIKLAVRDAILESYGSLLASAAQGGFKSACEALGTCMPAIGQTALTCARRLGFEGSVSAEAGTFWLPEKAYGQVTLPAGEYQALRITLGSGQGQNWWCVLFPQLCLSLSGNEYEASRTNMHWNSQRIFARWLLLGQ